MLHLVRRDAPAAWDTQATDVGAETCLPTVFIVHIVGHSMEPVVPEGSLVCVDAARRDPMPGEIVAVYIHAEGRMIGYWSDIPGTLTKANPAFGPVDLNRKGPWEVLGTVVATVADQFARLDPVTTEPDTRAIEAVLGLAPRTVSALRRAGINTMRDLQRRTEDDLGRVWGIGRQSREHIVRALDSVGRSLRPGRR